VKIVTFIQCLYGIILSNQREWHGWNTWNTWEEKS